jgi:hypothetical protein
MTSYIESKPLAQRGGALSMPEVWYAPDRHRASKSGAAASRRRMLALAMVTAMLGPVLLVANPQPAASQGVQLVKVDVAVVAKGYRASKMIGATVTNDKNEKIGTLDDIIVDQKNVMFAVLQVGGFLGMGGHLIAVPYADLKIDETGKKIVLPGASKDELKKLSEFKYQT